MVLIKPQVLSLIEEQMTSMDQPIEALFIVGGFAGNEYPRQRIEVRKPSVS
jgi:hypothetical protein